MRFPGFIGPTYKLRSVNVDCQRCIGLYPEINENGTAKENEIASLVATPGLIARITLGDGPIRGTYASSNGRAFAVSANKLYELFSDWTSLELGTLETFSGQVGIADNGTSLVVVDGPNGYSLLFEDNTFAEITDENFLGATQVTFQDGYLAFNQPDTNIFYYTGLNALTFDGLDKQSSEGSPDNVVGIISNYREMWVFNRKTIEIFYNAGGAENVFQRLEGAFVEVGCIAPFSIAKMNSEVFWIGQDENGAGIVFRAKGYQPQRVSTHAVEQAIQRYGDISDAVAYTYQENGHFFYVLNFTSANTTWVFDTTTNLWHERVYTNQGQFERHRANSHAFVFGKHLVGDYANGKIYEMTSDAYSDDGNPITRQRVTPHVSTGMKRVFFHSLQLDIESGVGLDGTGQGTNPQAMLDWSDDNGHSWSNENWVSFGKIGETKKRAIWRRIGQAYDRVFRVTITDPVRVTLIGAELELEKGVA